MPSTLILLIFPGGWARGAEVKLDPMVIVETKYNDNVFLDRVDLIRDFILKASPMLRYIHKTERLETSLLGRLDWIKYADTTELDDLDFLFQGSAGYMITPRWNVSAEAMLKRDSQPDRDLDSTGLRIGPATRHKQRYALSTEYILSEKSGAAFSCFYQQDDFDDPEYTDSRSLGGDLILTRNLGALFTRPTNGRVNLGFSKYDYPESSVASYSLTLGVSRDFTERLGFLFDVGTRYTLSEYEVPIYMEWGGVQLPFILGYETMKTTGWGGTGQLLMTYKNELSDLEVRLYQDISEASGYTGPLERTALSVEYNKRFTRYFNIKLNMEFFLNRAEGDEFYLREVRQKTFTCQPRVQYVLNRYISFEFVYHYLLIINDVAKHKTQRNVVFARFIYKHPLMD
ncbi:MAG: hypothetical protein GY859_38820 [Desulfobacterales bacterium]|nr:hypothetical protein [Desulfobacterales bacterium]